MGPEIIELTPENLAVTLAAIKEMSPASRLDVDSLRDQALGDPTCPPDLLLLAQVGDDIAGFCFARILEGVGVIKLFGVRECLRRRGIATALFDEIEGRLQGRGVGSVSIGPRGGYGYFAPGVDLRLTSALSFLLQRGYETDRVARVDMAVDLRHVDLETHETEKRLKLEGIVLCRARANKVRSVADFALRYFSTGWGRGVTRAKHFHPPPLFIALDDECPVGFAAYDLSGVSQFGPMGTRPDY